MQHRARRRVEQLDLGDAVENARDQLRQPPERVLAPIHLRDRDPLVGGGERRARVLTGPPQRPRGRGAQLDGLLEADVERDGERLRDARDDPLERDRVVETGHQQRELVTADRRREARRHDERQPVGCVAQHPVADLVAVPVVDHLHVVEIDEDDPARARLGAEPCLQTGEVR